jgi:hypothetical protein
MDMKMHIDMCLFMLFLKYFLNYMCVCVYIYVYIYMNYLKS